jgi:hypothetical protein
MGPDTNTVDFATYAHKCSWLFLSVHKIVCVDDTNNVLEFVSPGVSGGSIPVGAGRGIIEV